MLNSLNKFIAERKIYIVLCVVAAIYIAFPTHNSTIDAWGYATEIKYATNLFSSHHLLYNFSGFILFISLKYINFNIEVLQLMKILNGIIGVFILYNLYRILQIKNNNSDKNILLILIVAFSFGFWRFTTENENYIIPIYFSLLGSLFFLKYINSSQTKYLFWTSFWAAFACLFHQIHFWWWLGLLIGFFLMERFQWKKILLFLMASTIVPIVYGVVIFSLHQEISTETVLRFVFYEYYQGNITQEFGLYYVVMTGINFVRSFVQIHGLIYLLIKEYEFMLLFGIMSVFVLLYVLKKYQINFHIKYRNDIFIKAHIVIFVLHFLFAFYAVGNAEFMAMFPLLSVLILQNFLYIDNRILIGVAVCLFTWNFAYGIFPNYFFDLQKNDKINTRIFQEKHNIFIMRERPIHENRIFYETGQEFCSNLYSIPSHLAAKNRNVNHLKTKIDSTLNAGGRVYTDALNGQFAMSRATALATENTDSVFFSQYPRHLVQDSVVTLLGKSYLTEIKR